MLRDQVGVVGGPPRREGGDGTDVSALGEMRGDARSHRVADHDDVGRGHGLQEVVEGIPGVVKCIEATRVPAAESVAHPADLDAWAQSSTQPVREHSDADVGELPWPRPSGTGWLSTRQDQDGAANITHDRYSEQDEVWLDQADV